METAAEEDLNADEAAGLAPARPLLGYWAIRGLAEPIRALHAYLGVGLNEKIYGKPFYKKANAEMKEWGADKAELDMALPNLPYYVDGDLKLSEAAAIMRYVCEKHAPELLLAPGFAPLQGKAKHDQVFTFLFCTNNSVRSYHYGYLPQTRTKVAKEKDGRAGALYFKDVWTHEKDGEMKAVVLEQVVDALDAGGRAKAESGTRGSLLFGVTPTAADFVLYEHTCLVQCQVPEVADLEEVRTFRAAFEALPRIKEYLASPERIIAPFNAPIAHFGASMDDPYTSRQGFAGAL